MTETTLVLIRHGQTDWNLKRRYQGRNDIPLNGTGVMQAEKAAVALRDEMFDGIISSNLSRAHRTAQIIGSYHELEIEVDERLAELSFGDWEGLTWDEIVAQYPDESRQWRENTMAGAPGGETFDELAVRARSFLDSMRDKGGRYAVVAHGGTIRALVAACLDLEPARSWQLRIQNVSISEIGLYGKASVLNRWNDTHHLERKGKIRPISIGIMTHQDHIFVSRFFDPETGHEFYRPLGGGIEFNERGAETLVREIDEELHTTIGNVTYLKTIENIFTHQGEPGHEIVQVYRAAFLDPAWNNLEKAYLVPAEGFEARWMPLSAFGSPDSPPLYPDEILSLAKAITNQS